jgi:hypothetical protein
MKEVQLKVRIPQSLHKLIENAAEKSHRSIAGEVTLRLQQSFEQPAAWDKHILQTLTTEAVDATFARLIQKLGEEKLLATAAVSGSIKNITKEKKI